ncbi:hypothetical protein OF83DRAFT_799617 [Amylostereum chailletii]|nr:hypothetical protein OF83DRAFT_799617 [Amylostereum chailletii]
MFRMLDSGHLCGRYNGILLYAQRHQLSLPRRARKVQLCHVDHCLSGQWLACERNQLIVRGTHGFWTIQTQDVDIEPYCTVKLSMSISGRFRSFLSSRKQLSEAIESIWRQYIVTGRGRRRASGGRSRRQRNPKPSAPTLPTSFASFPSSSSPAFAPRRRPRCRRSTERSHLDAIVASRPSADTFASFGQRATVHVPLISFTSFLPSARRRRRRHPPSRLTSHLFMSWHRRRFR